MGGAEPKMSTDEKHTKRKKNIKKGALKNQSCNNHPQTSAPVPLARGDAWNGKDRST
jgi:hypothetical protein